MAQSYAIVLESYMITEESFSVSSLGQSFKNFGAMIKTFLQRILAKIREFFTKHFSKANHIHIGAARIYHTQLLSTASLVSSVSCEKIINNTDSELFHKFKVKFEEIKDLNSDIREAIMKAPDKKNYAKQTPDIDPKKECDTIVAYIKNIETIIDPGTDIKEIPMYAGNLLTMLSELVNMLLANYNVILWKGNKAATSVELGDVSAQRM